MAGWMGLLLDALPQTIGSISTARAPIDIVDLLHGRDDATARGCLRRQAAVFCLLFSDSSICFCSKLRHRVAFPFLAVESTRHQNSEVVGTMASVSA